MKRTLSDQEWMQRALHLAQKAALKGEIPVAALVVGPEGLISSALNTRERHQTPLGHAELIALHKASKARQSWRLADCTLYVTLEPCPMCAGAIQQARLARVVYGAKDVKGGGAGSIYNILQDERLNHQVEITSGVLGNECSGLMSSFFKNKRKEVKILKNQRIDRDRVSVVVIHGGKILGFYAEDPTSKKNYFFIPGGAIEPSESYLQAAARECFEETGYKVHVHEDTAFTKAYEFFWDGKNYFTKTTFYLATLAESWTKPGVVKDAGYHRGVDWLPVKNIPETFSYQSEILGAVQKLLKTSQKRRSLKV